MSTFTKPSTYRLQSISTGRIFNDTGWILDDDQSEQPTLIRALYDKRQIDVKGDEFGIYKFADWMPVSTYLKGSSAPVTYKSDGLAKYLGLQNLYVTFSGYWPEIGANMRTCSFKETESYTVCARLVANTDKTLVVASAGNTARAFARVCSDNDIPLLLCVPEDRVEVLWFDEPVKSCVKLIASRHGSDYFDAIHLSNLACALDQYVMEGGAKNIARRDGMGTTVLSAATTIGKIPDYYFQAVGSGTGAIAAWEANLRLIADGRFGKNKMKLLVSQNEPFIPLYHAWNKKSRTLDIHDQQMAREQAALIDAKVLSNRKPPYGLAGGLFDALLDTNGQVLTVSNEKSREAAKLFLELEGNDLHPAAAVAAASLIDAVNSNLVEKDAIIMLNVTGGGEDKFKLEKELHYLKPELIFDIDPDFEEVKFKLENLFQ
ncbi:MAG: cysteate synthase [Bacteroidales bacterium]|nr:cysteate synthase [Bacteroidales bacterium]